MPQPVTRNLSARALTQGYAPTEDEPGERESGVRARPPAPEDDDDALPFRRVGHYELLEPLGSGAMGRIFCARHVLLDRFVAIKILRPELADDATHVERFLTEARAVNLLQHPHVIDVMDMGMECGPLRTPWLVMELLEGQDVARLLTYERIAVGRALQIVRQVCEALDAIHSVGIVHRDIKPENIFITQREGRDFVKLIDFGVAHLRRPRAGSLQDLEDGVIGTPRYMAPEQIGGHAIDHRADVYAVGSVLFELISGEPPLDADDLTQLLNRVLHTRAPALSSRVSLPLEVRDELDRLIARCLEKDPCDRPGSAREVIAAIDDIMIRLATASSNERAPRHDLAVACPLDEPMPTARAPRAASNMLHVAVGALTVIALCVGARKALEQRELSLLDLSAAAAHLLDLSAAAAHVVVPERPAPSSPLAPAAPPAAAPAPAPAPAPVAESTAPELALTEPILVTATGVGLDAVAESAPASAEERRARRESRAERRRARAEAAAESPILVLTRAPEPTPEPAPTLLEAPIPSTSIETLGEPRRKPASDVALDRDAVLRPFH